MTDYAELEKRLRQVAKVTPAIGGAGCELVEAADAISALTKQLEERDRVATEAVEFIGVMRDEMVIAGWPSGDRTVLLANVRALLSRAPAEQGQRQGEK